MGQLRRQPAACPRLRWSIRARLRLPIITASARKDAVARRLDLKIRERSDPVLYQRAVSSQRFGGPFAFFDWAGVTSRNAEIPLPRRRCRKRRIQAKLVRGVAGKLSVKSHCIPRMTVIVDDGARQEPRADRMEPVFKGGDNAEVAAAAVDTPK